MSQYQRQRLSEADFAQEVKEYYTAKKPYDELISKMPMIPGDKEGSSTSTCFCITIKTDRYVKGDKAPNSLQSAANAAGAQTKATAQDHKATPVRLMTITSSS